MACSTFIIVCHGGFYSPSLCSQPSPKPHSHVRLIAKILLVLMEHLHKTIWSIKPPAIHQFIFRLLNLHSLRQPPLVSRLRSNNKHSMPTNRHYFPVLISNQYLKIKSSTPNLAHRNSQNQPFPTLFTHRRRRFHFHPVTRGWVSVSHQPVRFRRLAKCIS